MSLEDISLLVLPTGVKEDAIASVIPPTQDGVIPYTRLGKQAYIDKEGILKFAEDNVPVIEYDENNEPYFPFIIESTNLCDVSLVDSYNKSATIVRTTGFAKSPTGINNAVKLEKGSSGNEYYNLRVLSSFLNNNSDYTHSIFVKRSSNDFTFRLEHNVSTNYGVAWNVSYTLTSSGVTINSEANAVGDVKYFGDGWYRVSATVTTTTPTTSISSYLFRLDDTNSVGESILLQYHQVEESAFATPLIETNSATASLGYSDIQFDDIVSKKLIGISEGYILLDLHADLFERLTSNDFFVLGTSNGRVYIYNSGSTLQYPRVYVESSDGSFNSYGLTKTRNLILFNIKGNTVEVWVEGSSSPVIDTGKVFSFTSELLRIRSRQRSFNLYGFCLGTKLLSDEECLKKIKR